jgi:hypothetical protein
MIVGFLKMVAILIGFALSLRILGTVMSWFGRRGLKDPAVIRAEYRRLHAEPLRKYLLENGPQTRLVSFEVWPNK